MKKFLPFLFPLLVLFVYLGAAQGTILINNKGAGTPTNDRSPVAVGTSTPVVIIPATMRPEGRCNWAITWTEAGNLVCQPVIYPATTSVIAPTTSHGFMMSAARTWTDSTINGDPNVGWECVSTSGTLNIYTFENNEQCVGRGARP